MLRLTVTLATGLCLGACNRAPDPETTPTPSEETPPAAVESESPKASAATPPPSKGARTWTFDDAAVGEMPQRLRRDETGGQGTPATWQTVAEPGTPTPPHAFGITASSNDKRTYNLAIVEGVEQADVDLSVMVRATGGVLNQGGGPIWRVADASNYYIARWDPVEDNAYLYVMQGGVRTALAKVDLELTKDAWHTLRVVMEGSHMELFIDDEPVLEAEDSSLPAAGTIGLWTKSDATTLFDDLSLAAP